MPQKNFVTAVAKDGRIVIPAALRRELGIRPGDKLNLKIENGELRVWSRTAALRRLQDEVARVVPKGVSLAQQLIQDRRRESARE